MHPRDSGAKDVGQKPFGCGWFWKNNIDFLAYLTCHRQYWAIWMLDGPAIYAVLFYGAELLILTLNSFSEALGFAVFSKRPRPGLIFNSGRMLHEWSWQTVQLGSAANGWGSIQRSSSKGGEPPHARGLWRGVLSPEARAILAPRSSWNSFINSVCGMDKHQQPFGQDSKQGKGGCIRICFPWCYQHSCTEAGLCFWCEV